ncbi:helix-turn-helix domain-containing protein [Nonomuraea wenchangensis]|uniref:helix-turn-helix domain-containing protein n=1 Tax=Nonomuraea wenchangensis TaxID=568860 RepID=UPI003322A9BA
MNLDELYTADEAATETGFKRQAIYNWVARGYLAPVPGAKRGRSRLFRLEDVFAAERTRDHTRRRRSNAC